MEATGPGWSMNRVAVLMMTGVAAGAGIGIATFEVIAGVGALTGMLGGGALPTGSDIGFYVLGLAFAAVAGAVLATAAAVGAMVALVLFDHWGERAPGFRAMTGGLGAAAGAAVLGVIYVGSASGTVAAWSVAVGAVVSGALAGAGLYLFEKRMRSAPRLPPVP